MKHKFSQYIFLTSCLFSLFLYQNSFSQPAVDDCPEEKNVRCEFGQWYTAIEFFPAAFQGSYGYLREQEWYIAPSEGFRAGCAILSPDMDLIGPGGISGTVKYSGSFQDWINDPAQFNQLFLFELVLSYLDQNQKRHRKSELIPVQQLGHLHLIGSHELYGRYYYATSAGEQREHTIRLNVAQDASHIRLGVCSIFPGTTLKVKSLQIETFTH